MSTAKLGPLASVNNVHFNYFVSNPKKYVWISSVKEGWLVISPCSWWPRCSWLSCNLRCCDPQWDAATCWVASSQSSHRASQSVTPTWRCTLPHSCPTRPASCWCLEETAQDVYYKINFLNLEWYLLHFSYVVRNYTFFDDTDDPEHVSQKQAAAWQFGR